MASDCPELCLSTSSHGMKDSTDDSFAAFKVADGFREDSHTDENDGICSSVSRYLTISHPHQNFDPAKKDFRESGVSSSYSTQSIKAPLEAYGFSDSFDKIRQSFEFNMGRTRGIREPVIAWGEEDSKKSSVSALQNSVVRGDSHSCRRQPPSCSEDSSVRRSRQLPSSHEGFPGIHPRDSAEPSPDTSTTLLPDAITKQTKPTALEEAYVPDVISKKSKPSQVHTGGEEKEEKEAASAPPSSPTSRVLNWELVEEPAGIIHDFPNDLSPRHQGRSSIQASSTFQETMVDLFGYPDYSHPPPPHSVSQIASRTLRVNGVLGKFLRSRRGRAQAGDGCGQEVDHLAMDNAQRGWRALRTYLQDQSVSKRTSQSALNWNMLRHTVKGMATDQEKTRQDLYKRYGIIPSEDDKGNVVMVNSMLSERARKSSTGSRHASRERTVSARSPERGEPARSGVWITSKLPRSNPQTKHLSSSLPAMFSSPSPGKAWEDLSSQRGRPAGISRGRGATGAVRPHSSVGARTKGTGSGDGGSGSGLLPLRKISEPTFRASRSLDS